MLCIYESFSKPSPHYQSSVYAYSAYAETDIHERAHIHSYIGAYIRTYIHTYTHIYLQKYCLHMYMHMHMYTRMRMHVYMYVYAIMGKCTKYKYSISICQS